MILVKYVINNGWNYAKGKRIEKIEQGDFFGQ